MPNIMQIFCQISHNMTNTSDFLGKFFSPSLQPTVLVFKVQLLINFKNIVYHKKVDEIFKVGEIIDMTSAQFIAQYVHIHELFNLEHLSDKLSEKDIQDCVKSSC